METEVKTEAAISDVNDEAEKDATNGEEGIDI